MGQPLLVSQRRGVIGGIERIIAPSQPAVFVRGSCCGIVKWPIILIVSYYFPTFLNCKKAKWISSALTRDGTFIFNGVLRVHRIYCVAYILPWSTDRLSVREKAVRDPVQFFKFELGKMSTEFLYHESRRNKLGMRGEKKRSIPPSPFPAN